MCIYMNVDVRFDLWKFWGADRAIKPLDWNELNSVDLVLGVLG